MKCYEGCIICSDFDGICSVQLSIVARKPYCNQAISRRRKPFRHSFRPVTKKDRIAVSNTDNAIEAIIDGFDYKTDRRTKNERGRNSRARSWIISALYTDAFKLSMLQISPCLPGADSVEK